MFECERIIDMYNNLPGIKSGDYEGDDNGKQRLLTDHLHLSGYVREPVSLSRVLVSKLPQPVRPGGKLVVNVFIIKAL